MGAYRRQLQVLRVERPCAERWDAMDGDGDVRFCYVCRAKVYDLSGLTRPQIQALVEREEGAPCVRMYVRADGTVVTREDCAPFRRAWWRRRLRRGLKIGAAVCGVVLSVAYALTRGGSAPVREPGAPRASEVTYGFAEMAEPTSERDARDAVRTVIRARGHGYITGVVAPVAEPEYGPNEYHYPDVDRGAGTP